MARSKLLIVEGSIILQGLFSDLLSENENFDFDLVGSYEDAKKLLSKKRYEFAVTDRVLKDAPNGEIIALFNKFNIAPLVFTKDIDEDFFESFEGAQIVDYMVQQRFTNVADVVKKLEQLKQNKSITVLVVSSSKIYTSYLKQNLNIHSFKVFTAFNDEDVYEKLELHPEISLMVIDSSSQDIDSLEILKHIRKTETSDHIKILTIADDTNLYSTSIMLNHGADDYIVKQFSRDEFYIRVYQNIKKVC